MVGQYSASGGPLKGPGGLNGPPVCYLKYALLTHPTYLLRPQLHDTGFALERHQFKVFSSLVCYYNFLYMKFLFNYIILSYF